LDRQFSSQGLRCQYRQFETLDELKHAGLTLAMIRGGRLTNHCVAVLAINDRQVVVADPSLGKLHIPIDQFAAEWRHTGITLRRDPVSGI
jgi:predicted double-glycine peptidase